MPEMKRSSSDVTTGRQFDEALQAAFDKALRAAEAFMEQADRAQDKAARLLAAEIGTVAVAVAVAAIIVILGFPSGILGRVLLLIIGGVAGLVVAGAIHLTVRARLVDQSNRDEQAAVDLVSLLREDLLLITDFETWNETQLRLARARLSRFPI
jgi:hypothetical protein